MKTSKNGSKQSPLKLHTLYLFIGIIISVLLLIPYFILGKSSIFTYHDQLDGELISYLLTAKYLFTGVDIYPELLNGIPSTGAIPPAFLFVFLYKIFPPFSALLLSQWIISVIAFLGSYLLVFRFTKRRFPAFLSGILFMLLPFYPVYGLCIPGQPLLWYCIHKIRAEKNLKVKPLYYIYILLYSLCSSLVLVGFACLIVLFIASIYFTIKNLKNHGKVPFDIWLSSAVLLFGYFISNLSLIRQILNPSPGMISHKSEVVPFAESFFNSFIRYIYPGENYTETWPAPILVLAATGLFLFFFTVLKKGKEETAFIRLQFRYALIILVFLLLCALWGGIYATEFFIKIRNALPGALSGFNFSRFSWLMPTAWLLLAAFLANAILPLKPDKKPEESAQKQKISLFFIVRYGMVTIIYLLWFGIVLLHSPLKVNISKIIKGPDQYYALDFEKFYAEDIFKQIDDAIGLPKESYKVVSIGIYPAAAAYNGFYCLDGYSNNYPLEYKHAFREVFADELDKNDYIRSYYDNWGNRCYITTTEFGNYYCVERKWNGGFHNLSVNTDKLKELGCKYIFAASYILNYEELNLEPLREEPFISENSWYNIYVYEIK